MPFLRCAAFAGLLATLLSACGVALAAADASDAQSVTRPRVALVLSGGGARGLAHVGALRALQELQVPVDMVVGVSMGSVVGGAYASGRTVDELEVFVRSTDWTSIVSDRPPRDDLAFRRREEDVLVPSRIEFGVTRGGVSLPPSAAGNNALEAALTRLLPAGAAERPVNRLPLPFRSVASDLLTGELVELKDTPLFMSMRASLSVPGVFAPVRLDGRLVVDGGLVRNLPVDIARAMGAQVIIAVNVGTPLAKESELASALGVAQQMLQILTEQNVQRSIKELTSADVLISPNLDGISFLDFTQREGAMAAGHAAVKAHAERLKALAVSPQDYAAVELARTAPRRDARPGTPLAKVTVLPTPHASSEALATQMGLDANKPITLDQVTQAAAQLHARGDFDRVQVDVRDVDGKREAVVTPVESTWARSRLRLGVEFSSDFADDNRFTVSALHVMPWLNSWGAELRSVARIGSTRALGTQLWQPLAPGSSWFVKPGIQYDSSSADLFADGRRIARVDFNMTTASLALGRQLSSWGNAQLGIVRRVGDAHFLIAPPQGLDSGHFDERAYFAQFQYDTLDSLAFPSRGAFLDARWEWGAWGSRNSSARQSAVIAMKAVGFGKWAGHVYGEWARSSGGIAPLQLGGFLRLTGTPRNSVDGRVVVLGRMVIARHIGQMPTGLGGAVRGGFSVEYGGAFDEAQHIRIGEMRQAGSAFVSVDTRFGPVFLAVGTTRGIGGTLYLFLGPFW